MCAFSSRFGLFSLLRFAIILIAGLCIPCMAATPAPFTAEYKIYFGDWHLGTGTYSFEKIDNEFYAFNFESAMKILLFSDYRKVRSEASIENNRLFPVHYTHERKGTGKDYTDVVSFDKKDKTIKSTSGENTVTSPYDKKFLDGLSVQLQLMLDVQRRDQTFIYHVFENNAVETVIFKKLGKRTLTIDDKQYECLQFEAIRRGGQLVTHIWFAESLNYMPVQMAHFINGSKRFNGKLIRYHEQE